METEFRSYEFVMDDEKRSRIIRAALGYHFRRPIVLIGLALQLPIIAYGAIAVAVNGARSGSAIAIGVALLLVQTAGIAIFTTVRMHHAAPNGTVFRLRLSETELAMAGPHAVSAFRYPLIRGAERRGNVVAITHANGVHSFYSFPEIPQDAVDRINASVIAARGYATSPFS